MEISPPHFSCPSTSIRVGPGLLVPGPHRTVVKNPVPGAAAALIQLLTHVSPPSSAFNFQQPLSRLIAVPRVLGNVLSELAGDDRRGDSRHPINLR